MNKVFDPTRSGAKVHYTDALNKQLLCGLSPTHRTVDGHEYLQWYPTDRPVGCTQCTKGLEVIVRRELENLTALGLEKVLDVIGKMRNGELKASGA